MKHKKAKEPEEWFVDLESGFDELSRKQLAEFDALAGKLDIDLDGSFPDLSELWPARSSDEVETESKEEAKTGSPDEAPKNEEENP